MATIGDVLDEFFSPFGRERLWVMPESDNYTRIVRFWKPVTSAVDAAKANLVANCADWSSNHVTSSTWTPGMTDPPVTDPNSHRVFVPSPPGTDPDTCKEAFVKYVVSKIVRVVSRFRLPEVQTYQLYTCSIGSFNIYVTVDSVDCAAQTAILNIWMYNCMSKRSFGRFADDPTFAASAMEKQYMWWNWKEGYSWGANPPPTPGSSGASGGW